MTENKTSLRELLPNSDLEESIKSSVKIIRVEIDREELIMKLYLENSLTLGSSDKDKILKQFSEKFDNFKVSIEYKESGLANTEDALLELVKNKIRKHIPSSLSWLGDIALIAEDDYIIQLPHYLAYQSVTRNGLKVELSEIIRIERDKGLQFRYGELEASDEYLLEKELEERKILKEIIAKVPEQKKRGAPKSFSIGKKIRKEIID
ncbi:MAG TPA: hypothetical protein PKD08_05435, partial [Gudongella oleilytica]|nr:hypothetical protein [Gudongella oleilytica]